MTWMTRGSFVAFAAVVAGGLAGHPSQLRAQGAPTPAQSIAAGSRVYGEKGCSGCHAINGVGADIGPDLAHISAPSLASLVAALWNHLPKMADRMRTAGHTAPHFEPWEAANLMAFLFWAAAWTPPGDTVRGRELFTSRHCILCHRVGNEGGVIGPALDGLRAVASPIDLAADLWNHAPAMAEQMRARGVARPTLSGRDIDDLLAFFGVGSGDLPRSQDPLQVLHLSGSHLACLAMILFSCSGRADKFAIVGSAYALDEFISLSLNVFFCVCFCFGILYDHIIPMNHQQPYEKYILFLIYLKHIVHSLLKVYDLCRWL